MNALFLDRAREVEARPADPKSFRRETGGGKLKSELGVESPKIHDCVHVRSCIEKDDELDWLGL